MNLNQITNEEAIRVLRQNSDTNLRESIIQKNRGIVIDIAKKYRDKGIRVPFNDIENNGNIGLVKAVDRFQPERGTKFSTFAVRTITGEIQRYIRDHEKPFSFPTEVYDNINRIRTFRKKYLSQHHQEPTVDDILDGTDIPLNKLKKALEIESRLAVDSIDAKESNEEGDGISHLERLAKKSSDEQETEGIENKEILQQAISILSPIQRRAICFKFFSEMPHKEIGERMNYRPNYIGRIINEAYSKMRRYFEANDISISDLLPN